MKHIWMASALSAGILISMGTAIAAPEPFAGIHSQQMTIEDMSALLDARIAGMKTGLKLNAAQENLWPALEAAIRENAKARMAHRGKLDEKSVGGQRDAMATLLAHAQIFSSRAEQMQKLARAAKPLYDTFDESQKRRFGVLIRSAMHARGHHGALRHGMTGHGMTDAQ